MKKQPSQSHQKTKSVQKSMMVNPLAIQALPSVEEGTTAYCRSRIGTDKYTDWSTAVAEMVDAGELFIQAKAVNPNNHDALCEYALKISHKPVTVKADDMEKMYVEQDPTLNATMEGFLNEDTLTYTLTRDAGENAGSYKITPHGDSIQKDYEVTYQTGTLTIPKSNLMKLEAASSKKVYDAKPFTQQVIPFVKEGSIVLYSLDCRTWKQDQPYIADAGVLNVKAKVEHPNYETVTIDYTLEIIPRKVTLTSATTKK